MRRETSTIVVAGGTGRGRARDVDDVADADRPGVADDRLPGGAGGDQGAAAHGRSGVGLDSAGRTLSPRRDARGMRGERWRRKAGPRQLLRSEAGRRGPDTAPNRDRSWPASGPRCMLGAAGGR
jgi:hypothetical protein